MLASVTFGIWIRMMISPNIAIFENQKCNTYHIGNKDNISTKLAVEGL